MLNINKNSNRIVTNPIEKQQTSKKTIRSLPKHHSFHKEGLIRKMSGFYSLT